jgi:hypothetical protein
MASEGAEAGAKVFCAHGHPVKPGTARCPRCGSDIGKYGMTKTDHGAEAKAKPEAAVGKDIPARKAIPVIIVLILVFAWVMSRVSGGNGEPMGSGAECTQKLSQVVTTSYLLDHGLQVKDSQAATIQVGGAIADVCLQGPSTKSVDDGAEKVVDWINARLDASG